MGIDFIDVLMKHPNECSPELEERMHVPASTPSCTPTRMSTSQFRRTEGSTRSVFGALIARDRLSSLWEAEVETFRCALGASSQAEPCGIRRPL